MANLKDFYTRFNIAAKFTGKPAFEQANRAARQDAKERAESARQLRQHVPGDRR